MSDTENTNEQVLQDYLGLHQQWEKNKGIEKSLILWIEFYQRALKEIEKMPAKEQMGFTYGMEKRRFKMQLRNAVRNQNRVSGEIVATQLKLKDLRSRLLKSEKCRLWREVKKLALKDTDMMQTVAIEENL